MLKNSNVDYISKIRPRIFNCIQYPILKSQALPTDSLKLCTTFSNLKIKFNLKYSSQ